MAAITTETAKPCPALAFEGLQARSALAALGCQAAIDIEEEPARTDSATAAIQPEHADFDSSNLLPIPIPPASAYFGLLGHAPDLNPLLPVSSYWSLMDQYAPIFQLHLNTPLPRIFVGSRDLVNEMADDSRFVKFTHRLHQMMRPVFGNGLFSAETTDPAWAKAHRVLKPALGPLGLSRMFDDMQDISAQLVQMWDRHGPKHEIDCLADMSRLTFDTIGLCAYGYRFNQFYLSQPHSFERQLREAIVESGKRANRPDLVNLFYYKDEQHRQENIVNMRSLCRQMIQERLEHPQPDARDLLNVMLHNVDKETGEQLGVENVMFQIPTLLGGGYETTSSTLCFIYYFLCKYPETLKKAQQEIDEVVGTNVLTYEMLKDLKYVDAVMKEALRMQHPVSLLTRFAIKDTILGGKYLVQKGQMVSGIWKHFHRDPAVWGEDADTFRPERMLEENFQQMPPNSWKPFGDGLRACIGRGFAEQEILIHLAMALQKFDVRLANPDYDLELKGQMGVKPVDFKILAKRRADRHANVGIPGGSSVIQEASTKQPSREALQRKDSHRSLTPVSILWGGNMGTCDELVKSLVRSGQDYGLEVVETIELDQAVARLPTGRPTLVVIPSYEGRPPDNARVFFSWLEREAKSGAKLPPGTQYCVFGVGNSDWVHTFHKVPRLVDQYLHDLDAERILPLELANVKRSVLGTWETWLQQLSHTLTGDLGDSSPVRSVGVQVDIQPRSQATSTTVSNFLAGQKLITGIVNENRLLSPATPGLAKRHLEVRLPATCSYQAGDYLAVQAHNPEQSVRRVLRRFQLHAEDMMTVSATSKDFLPAQPISVEHFLRGAVDLVPLVTPRAIASFVACASEGSAERLSLTAMSDEERLTQLIDRRESVLDVLERFPTLDVPFGVYVDLLPPLVPRLYSIASSPEHASSTNDGDRVAALTFDVVETPAANNASMFHGVASSYLSTRDPGDYLQCAVRPSRVNFRLPASAEVPVLMFAAGSGIAPMRAFLQEREARQDRGERLGPALLYIGCRRADHDFLYREELEAWADRGIVEIIPCFSRPGPGYTGRYVGDALWEHRERLWQLYNQAGAHIFVCGSAARLGSSVSSTWMRIWSEQAGASRGAGNGEAQQWLDHAKGPEGRYFSDVY